MAFDEGLAQRIREQIDPTLEVTEKKMFGGLCYLLNGNMCFGIIGSELMIRVGRDQYDDTLAMPHAREMDFTGRAMRGFVQVDESGLSEDDDLKAWLQRGLAYAATFPPK